MKKRIKLFSSALALGMLLGTGVGPITQIVQTGHRTTMVAKAATGEETRLENTVELTPDQITLNANNYIGSVQWNDGDKQKLLNGGTLIIPKASTNNSNIERPIKGVDHWVFSKAFLGGESDDGLGMKKVIFEGEEDIEYIGQNAFYDNQLSTLSLPNVKTIESEAFERNRITSVSINSSHDYIQGQDTLGTVNNPLLHSPFEKQKWDELTISYQPIVSIQELLDKLNISYSINKRSLENSFVAPYLEDSNNIEMGINNQLVVSSEKGGEGNVGFDLFMDSDGGGLMINGWSKLTVNAKNEVVPPLPGPGNNNNSSGTNPDNGNNSESGNNSGNEVKPEPAPKPEEKRPHTVYAKRGMRLHRNVSLTSPIRSYKKQSRAKAPSFRVRGVEYDKNGKKRYKVDGGYITAGSSYVADSHFRSNKVRQVRVLSNRINSYKDVKLSSNKKVRSYKKGTKLRVKRVVNWGRATRFELTNGRYITGNKQLLIMDQK